MTSSVHVQQRQSLYIDVMVKISTLTSFSVDFLLTTLVGLVLATYIGSILLPQDWKWSLWSMGQSA